MRLLQRFKLSWLVAIPFAFPFDAAIQAEEVACSYDGASHTVIIQAPPTEIEFADYRLEVVDERIEFDRAPCGEATVTNTDTILFSGLPPGGIASEYIAVHLPFAPGFSPEPEGVAEIEIVLDFPAGFGYVDVVGTDGPDSITLGTLGYNVNGDDDLDIQISGVTEYDIEGMAGPDRISTAGGRGTGAPVSVQHYLSLRVYGFEGRDRLIGGPQRSLLSGGRGRDVVRAGAGNDFLDPADWYGRDKLAGGGGHDRCFGTRADSMSGCERVFPPPF